MPSKTKELRGRRSPARVAKPSARRATDPGTPSWKLEDAKARFSEVVRRARTQGPQRVTYRGEDAVVVVAADEFARLSSELKPKGSLVEFLRGLALHQIPVRREIDRGREPDL